ncbi:hypothetical protein NK983_34150, partial [Salmonella enterica subsp. enterica serovar Typhimurium]|nr:hypothetical protein [Salmonella enterica subsp. enterica serovar Typhimurium]
MLHFAHGGLLAVGLMVSVFVVLRVAEAGLTPRMLPSLPEFSLLGSAQQVSADTDLQMPDLPATGSGVELTAQQKTVA